MVLTTCEGRDSLGGQVQGGSAARFSVRQVPRVWAAGTGPDSSGIARGLADRAACLTGPVGQGGSVPLRDLGRLDRVDRGEAVVGAVQSAEMVVAIAT